MIERSQLFFHDQTPRALGSLTLAGTLKSSRGTGRARMRVYGQRALVLLVAGSGRYRDASGTRARVEAGDALLVFPALPHGYGPRAGEHWDEIYLCFDGPIFDLWEAQGLLDSANPIARVEPEAMFGRLQTLAQTPRPTSERENWEQLAQLLAILAEIFPPRAVVPGQAWLQEARAELGANLGEPLALAEVARRVGKSYGAFRREFARAQGVSPGQYRAAERLKAARILLERGEMTNAAIARSLGYGDEAHFSKAFKIGVGHSPRAWKKLRPEGLEPPAQAL